ncbi:hypothetical protein BGZ99_008402 [Dissophora globulifera]|uniref:Initiator tRNA phosphoribosyl transferase n=1 Tax=Dissophora globulifera TaxID=979702 RepID=A0A9P6RT03_9FUNG|nr:hypothetical protein BGZ99_008402 [Dissophora globulifera]
MTNRIRATQINAAGSNRDDMRRDAKNLMNRLKSIQADAAFVTEIADLLPQFPVFENLFLLLQSDTKIQRPGVYFKSTDGHTSNWDFNLRRYNPHLLTAIAKYGGCIIVDSTRKGKRVPDALSKTIPIWCATINTAIRNCALKHQERTQEEREREQAAQNTTTSNSTTSSLVRTASDQIEDELNSAATTPSLDGTRWDTRYHSLPSLISRSEHAQIAERIPGFAEKLMRFTDLTPLMTQLPKPIRPIWFTPQSFFLKNEMPDYSEVAFFPVICLSASRVVGPEGMEERDGYLYVQGSGDDEEMWSRGLTPDLFWEHEEYLLEDDISAAECERRAREIVQKAKETRVLNVENSQNSLNVHERRNAHQMTGGRESGRMLVTPSMELCSMIKPTSIWIGNNASARIPNCWREGFDMVINCAAEIKRDPLFEGVENSLVVTSLGGTGAGGAVASLCRIQEHQLDAISSLPNDVDMVLPPRSEGGKEFSYLHLPIAEGKKGQHQLLEMIPIAVKAVERFYADRASCGFSDIAHPKILIHCQQGMDRSVGITLALLVACFDEATGEFCGTGSGRQATTPSKEIIQRRLFQIMEHRLAARPSRATLKMVNTYFMSPTDPPPAQYK